MLNESVNTMISFPLSIFLQREISPLACKSVKCVIWQVGKKATPEKTIKKWAAWSDESLTKPPSCVRVCELSHVCSKCMARLINSMTTLTFRWTNTEQRDRERALLFWITFTASNIFRFTRIHNCWTSVWGPAPLNVNNWKGHVSKLHTLRILGQWIMMLMRTHHTHHAGWCVSCGLCHTVDYEINANTGSDADHCEEDKPRRCQWFKPDLQTVIRQFVNCEKKWFLWNNLQKTWYFMDYYR